MGFFRDAYNLAFGKPVEDETLDSWAKICDDVTKACIIGSGGVLFLDLDKLNKIACIILLFFITYLSLVIARLSRQSMSKESTKENQGD